MFRAVEPTTAAQSLLGGALIGAAAVVLLLFNGRLAGISGILAGVLSPAEGGRTGWRLAFLAGLLAGGLVALGTMPGAFDIGLDRSLGATVGAGLLVGFGTRLGGGCTSGHGVCGIGRLSRRSLLATVTFMASGAATVLVVQRLLGGAL